MAWPDLRVKSLFSKVKWPGWGAVLWWCVTQIPAWKGRAVFWFGAAQELGGHVGLIATIVTSQWFGLSFLAFGVGWLLFVGEPEQTVRHPLAPILGWTILGVLGLAFWSVLVAGYAVTLTGQTVPRILTEEQREKLLTGLKAVWQGQAIYDIAVTPADYRAYQYAQQMIEVFRQTGWVGNIRPRTTDVPVPPGVFLVVKDTSIPLLTLSVMDLLDQVRVKEVRINIDEERDDRENYVIIVVGPKS